jgi:hypothetical protein
LKRNKHPRKAFDPISNKVPRVREQLGSLSELPIAWHIRSLDRGGPYCWAGIDEKTLWSTIHNKLANFETMKWSEVLGDTHHEIPKYKLNPEALKRLTEINQNDIDTLVSLHLSGTQIIWGIRKYNIFRILWWDPGHKVCPSSKKNT